MTLAYVTINKAVKFEEILTNKWITDDTLNVYFDLQNNIFGFIKLQFSAYW